MSLSQSEIELINLIKLKVDKIHEIVIMFSDIKIEKFIKNGIDKCTFPDTQLILYLSCYDCFFILITNYINN